MYRNEKSLQARVQESGRIKTRYADRLPVICERNSNCTNLAPIDKRKFLVPRDLTTGQFLYVVRKRLELEPSQAIFLMTESGRLPASSQTIEMLYDQEAHEDGFLYLYYTGENTFG